MGPGGEGDGEAPFSMMAGVVRGYLIGAFVPKYYVMDCEKIRDHIPDGLHLRHWSDMIDGLQFKNFAHGRG